VTSDADATAEKLASIPNVEIIVATFVDRATDGMVSVDFGQGPVVILSAGVTEPLPGDPVRVLRVNSTTIMVGPAYPLSGIGTITATGAPKLTVTTSAGSRQLPFISSYSAVNGDLVLIDWSSGGVVIGKVTAAPAGAYTPPASVITDYSVDFLAVNSGSIQSGSWNKNDVWASDSNKGAWFYGSAIADTIPDSAVVTRTQIYLPEFYNPYPAEYAAVGLHALSGPSGALSLTYPTVVAGGGWRDLPAGFGEVLKTGLFLGVGVQQLNPGSGYHKYYGTASDAASGQLRIDWTV